VVASVLRCPQGLADIVIYALLLQSILGVCVRVGVGGGGMPASVDGVVHQLSLRRLAGCPRRFCGGPSLDCRGFSVLVADAWCSAIVDFGPYCWRLADWDVLRRLRWRG